MRRGDIVTVAARGHYSGKPRPALIIQSDLFDEIPSVTVCLISSELYDAPLLRVTVEASDENGLTKPSQVMIDKITTVTREQIGKQIGALDDATILRVERSLTVFLGIAEAPKRRALRRARQKK